MKNWKCPHCKKNEGVYNTFIDRAKFTNMYDKNGDLIIEENAPELEGSEEDNNWFCTNCDKEVDRNEFELEE